MKKLFISLFLTFGLCLAVYAAQSPITVNVNAPSVSQYPKGYMTAMQTCSPFVGSQSMEMFGATVNSTKKILGKRNGYCVTEEITYAKGHPESRSKIVCNISDKDRKELVSAMLGLTSENTYKKPDGSLNYKGTPDGAVMTRLLNDPAICKTYTSR